ncbi:PREDICTED: uncharacterized protein LOC108564033 [Nicrophorus vespilloides]|uniref:Uncharacterized protein LOC108564033 n=1 Tax=Nicrophorus vespilloides TaxID=110193 RepID=A0ABM1MUZ5_NICVS|nr:PREDICTED: uncharacterized protein LOC108564033 [Nicrophorus vespilloides]
MEEVLAEGKNFRLVQEEELPEILELLGNYLPDSIKFHQTVKTYINDRVWDFHFYVAKSWPEQVVTLHFPGMTRTVSNHIPFMHSFSKTLTTRVVSPLILASFSLILSFLHSDLSEGRLICMECNLRRVKYRTG